MSATPEGARPLAVFDIDGVLADVSHRLHYLDVHRGRRSSPPRTPTRCSTRAPSGCARPRPSTTSST
ncbi:hypothetical protein [Pseudonocardia sp. ICBG601]|uniref:hypothetical protein n=1 Tax=Pseudonocardia sp. ICBG601 TaxID=2846759 RepID=UPI001CF65CBB|nr:hypothetical protein [Pseudonocardia sp. ICBG601]